VARYSQTPAGQSTCAGLSLVSRRTGSHGDGKLTRDSDVHRHRRLDRASRGAGKQALAQAPPGASRSRAPGDPRFGGREVATAGDGFLATSDRPAKAIRCVCAIREGVQYSHESQGDTHIVNVLAASRYEGQVHARLGGSRMVGRRTKTMGRVNFLAHVHLPWFPGSVVPAGHCFCNPVRRSSARRPSFHIGRSSGSQSFHQLTKRP
jgi:hypothetical protein